MQSSIINRPKSWTVKLLVGFSVLVLSNCSDTNSGRPEEVRVGGQVPTFSLKAVDGTTVTSRSLEGNVVVLNFWATWCQPCMGEIPELKEMAASSGAKVVSIALDEDGEKAIKPFVARNNITYVVLVGDQDLFQRFNGVGIPYTLVLDRSQRIVHIYRGPVSKASLEQDLKKIEQGA